MIIGSILSLLRTKKINMRNKFIVISLFSLIYILNGCNKSPIIIPKTINDKDLNGYTEYGVYFELGSNRTKNDTMIVSDHAKVYRFDINGVDSFNVDLSPYYSPEELTSKEIPVVAYISVCGFDFNGQNDEVGWSQSPLYFQYLNRDEKFAIGEQTGFVENSINFWMHPPRQDILMQNYTAPWPIIVYNQHQWKWAMTFNGTGWQNTVKKEWRDTTTFHYTYEVVSSELKKIEDKEYQCYRVEAVGKSKEGNPTASYLFCNTFGIYEYSCVNIDNSTFRMTFDHYGDCIKKE